MQARILIPAHCSAIPCLPFVIRNLVEEISTQSPKCIGKAIADETIKEHLLLIPIQCHAEGVIWRELKSLFMGNHNYYASLAISILRDNFQYFCREIKSDLAMHNNQSEFMNGLPQSKVASAEGKCLNKNDKNDKYSRCGHENNSNSNDLAIIDFNDFGQTHFWYERNLQLNSSLLNDLSVGRNETRRNRKRIKVIMPPYPSPSPSCLHPERLFTSALVKLENLQIRLQTLNAYIATLGGGYFLCRYLSTAVNLARSQRKVALAMGDESLADKCTVNEAYNFIHAGKIRYALKLIRLTEHSARKRKDELTISICKSAKWFAKHVARAAIYEYSIDTSFMTNDIVSSIAKASCSENPFCKVAYAPPSSTFDDFQRIRIVRDRTR